MKATLTQAEMLHVLEALLRFSELIQSYPEIVTQTDEDYLAVALEIVENK